MKCTRLWAVVAVLLLVSAGTPAAEEGEYALEVKVVHVDGEPKVVPVALREANPPPLTAEQQAAVDKALDRLEELVPKDAAAAETLFRADRARALRVAAATYNDATYAARKAIARAVATNQDTASRPILAKALLDTEKPSRKEDMVQHFVFLWAKQAGGDIPMDLLLELAASTDAEQLEALSKLPKLSELAPVFRKLAVCPAEKVRVAAMYRLGSCGVRAGACRCRGQAPGCRSGAVQDGRGARRARRPRGTALRG